MILGSKTKPADTCGKCADFKATSVLWGRCTCDKADKFDQQVCRGDAACPCFQPWLPFAGAEK